MVCHFLLDLRGVYAQSPTVNVDLPTLLSTVRFAGASIAGNIGAPINPVGSTQWTATASDEEDDSDERPEKKLDAGTEGAVRYDLTSWIAT